MAGCEKKEPDQFKESVINSTEVMGKKGPRTSVLKLIKAVGNGTCMMCKRKAVTQSPSQWIFCSFSISWQDDMQKGAVYSLIRLRKSHAVY